jgi:hypothetical protein
MPNWLRRCLYASLGLLWLSGLAWLILHWFFAPEAEFGSPCIRGSRRVW